jgi:hypothetical protein
VRLHRVFWPLAGNIDRKERLMATLIATGTVTLNPAFMQEIKEVNDELWSLLGKIRHACSRPIALSGNCRYFVDMLQELRDQLALHFALEEAYGYFDDPVEVSPELARQAERLRGEHRRLYLQLAGIADRAEAMVDVGHQALLATSIPGQFILFDEALQNHERRENELLLRMMDQDTGGED